MDAVDAAVACRKSVKIINSSPKSFPSEFGSSVYSGKSIVLKKPCKKFVRIENDSSIYFNRIARTVFRYVSKNGTVLKFTKFAEENDVDTNNILSLPSSIRRKKLTYNSSSDKLCNLNNSQKTESLQCSNIYSSSQNRKTITMLDVGPNDRGSTRRNKQHSGIVTKKENYTTEKDFSVNNSKIETSTEHKNANGGKCDKFTARKPIIIEGDMNVMLMKNRELPNKVFHRPKKILTQTEKESNNNTVKKTNKSMSQGDINVTLIRNKELPNKVFHQSKKILTQTEKESNNNTVKNTNLSMLRGNMNVTLIRNKGLPNKVFHQSKKLPTQTEKESDNNTVKNTNLSMSQVDMNATLLRNKEPPNKVSSQSKKFIIQTEKESNNNTIKMTNISMSPGHLKYNVISLNRTKNVKEKQYLENYTSIVSKKSTQNKETTIFNNHIENKSESNDEKSSPKKLLISPLTIENKECNEFQNLNIDKMKLQNSDTSINKQEKVNELSLTDNVEKYAKQDATSVSKKCVSESQLLDLNIPNCTITSQLKSLQINSDNDTNTNLQETTLIIERSIVSYSTHQNVNIKVLESNKEYLNNCLKNVCMIHTGSGPFNIMSVLRKQLKVGRNTAIDESNLCNDVKTNNDKILDIHASGVPILSTVQTKNEIPQHQSTLIKSFDTLQKNSIDQDIFGSMEYFSSKFQKEVYFLHNFIKSIQSLDMSEVEICSTNYISTLPTVHRDNVIEDKLSIKNQSNCDLVNLAGNPFKSICWFNLLIGDEYRRAKNLLFILKMREDALKDFSRSQIIFLENKKKKDYTNVCMLKKKQRGVLLKLQQECGEMHRIKKILLDITEKKNAIVMQNKRNNKDKLFKSCNLEVKFNSDKKIVQRLQPDKNRSPRHCSPIKCFNLSGTSYTDDSTELKQIECNTSLNNIYHFNASMQYGSVEKSGNKKPYTVRSINNKCEDKDFMLVDGTYLNILFKNLNLPEIFSHGKEYDVHSVALQGLVSSVNRLFECSKISLQLYKENADIKKFSTGLIESLSSKNSAPSTARSLIEEFGDFYESLNETDESISKNSIGSIAEEDIIIKTEVNETLDTQTPDIEIDIYEKSDVKEHESNSEVCNSEQEQNLDLSANNAAPLTSEKHIVASNLETTLRDYCVFHSDDYNVKEPIQDHLRQGYELPVRQCNGDIQIRHEDPCEFDETIYDLQNVNDGNFEDVITSTNMLIYKNNDKVDCQTFADNIIDVEDNGDKIRRPEDFKESVSEAEALRMKQLAIELEIKALEQQSQLTYCIREIPDKPPPPYTPPTPETISNNDRTTVLSMSGAFISKELIEEHVNQFYYKMYKEEADYDLSTNQITNEDKSIEHNLVDMCHDFIRDYCKESINKCKTVKSDSPWDCSNISPVKLHKSSNEVKSLITTDICDILVYNTEEDIIKSVQELQMKRYDYIEEILFAEWKKCEKEWTSLENNEISVKNQLVDVIIIKELDEMLEEYLQLIS